MEQIIHIHFMDDRASCTWEKTDLHCPACGVQSVWRKATGGGDFYEGEDHVCVAMRCRASFVLPGGVDQLEELSSEMDEVTRGAVLDYEALVRCLHPCPGDSDVP